MKNETFLVITKSNKMSAYTFTIDQTYNNVTISHTKQFDTLKQVHDHMVCLAKNSCVYHPIREVMANFPVDKVPTVEQIRSEVKKYRKYLNHIVYGNGEQPNFLSLSIFKNIDLSNKN